MMTTDNKIITHFAFALLAISTLAGCTQSTPSMMNTSRVQLEKETSVEQVPVDQLNEKTMGALAAQYRSYGSGPLDLTMMYNPKSKKFTAMNARQKLKEVQALLRQKGVKNMVTQTIAVPDGKESLLVTFDTVQAKAPNDCQAMPGLENNETGRFIGDYKFGCGVETMFAQQIARPSDLEGNANMDQGSGRRTVITLDSYEGGAPLEPLDGIERDDLSSGN